jgi:ribosomal protein L40E
MLVYCSNCGAKIDDEAYFCPQCGTKTVKGKAANTSYPSDEIRDAFYNVGVELERAFTVAARETQAAFKKARDNMQQKNAAPSTSADGVVCPKCGTKNVPGADFCNKCCNRLTPAGEPQKST